MSDSASLLKTTYILQMVSMIADFATYLWARWVLLLAHIRRRCRFRWILLAVLAGFLAASSAYARLSDPTWYYSLDGACDFDGFLSSLLLAFVIVLCCTTLAGDFATKVARRTSPETRPVRWRPLIIAPFATYAGVYGAAMVIGISTAWLVLITAVCSVGLLAILIAHR